MSLIPHNLANILHIAAFVVLLTPAETSAQHDSVDSVARMLSVARTAHDSVEIFNLLTMLWKDRHLDTAFAISKRTIALASQRKDNQGLALAYFFHARLADYISTSNRTTEIQNEFSTAITALDGKPQEDALRGWIEYFHDFVRTEKNSSGDLARLAACREQFLKQRKFFLAGMVQEDIINGSPLNLRLELLTDGAMLYKSAHTIDGVARMNRMRAAYHWHSESLYQAYSNNIPVFAKSLWKLSASEAESCGNIGEAARSENGLALIYIMQKKSDSALLRITSAMAKARAMNDPVQIEEYQQTIAGLRNMLSATERYNDSIEKYLILNDSLISHSSFSHVREMETRNMLADHDQEVRALRLSEAENRNQSLMLQLLAGGLSAVLVLTVVIFRNRQRYLMRIRDAELAAKLRLEKERIAQDLHDNIGTQLTSVAIGIRKLSKAGDITEGQVTHLSQSMNATLLELRDTIWAINKETVTLQALQDKVNNLFWRLQQTESNISFDSQFNCDLNFELLPAIAINLYRITQEAALNSLKHSGGSTLLFRIDLVEGLLRMTVSDNGAGFAATGSSTPEHYGLANMRKRAEEINAAFEIQSRRGEGTVITLAITV
jgi:signal transduction histidine kinase